MLQNTIKSLQQTSSEALSPLLSQADTIVNQISASMIDNSFTSQLLSTLSGNDQEKTESRKSTLKSFIRFSIIVPSATYGIGYFLARYRLLLHRRVYQLWWCLTATPCFVAAGAIAYGGALLNKIGIISDKTLFNFASDVTQGLCKAIHLFNPQLRIHNHATKNTVTGKDVSFNDLKRGCIYITNHTSFWDGFMVFSSPKMGFFKHVKMMGKAGISDIPVVGWLVFGCLQYFKVHFQASGGEKSEEDFNNWKLDQSAQEKEMERVMEWINAGNTFAFAPEGRCARDPETIQSPRHGMLKVFLDGALKKLHQVNNAANTADNKDTAERLTLKQAMPEIFLLTNYKTSDFWPYTALCPGLACDIHSSLSKFEYPDNLEEVWTKIDPKTNTPTLDAGAFSKALQTFMQEQLDYLKTKKKQ